MVIGASQDQAMHTADLFWYTRILEGYHRWYRALQVKCSKRLRNPAGHTLKVFVEARLRKMDLNREAFCQCELFEPHSKTQGLLRIESSSNSRFSPKECPTIVFSGLSLQFTRLREPVEVWYHCCPATSSMLRCLEKRTPDRERS